MLTQVTRAIVALLGAAILGSAGLGYAASNDAPIVSGGEAAADVNGYVITNVSYGLNDANPTLVDAVSFDMMTEPGAAISLPTLARVRHSNASDDWCTCWSDTTVSPNRFAAAQPSLRTQPSPTSTPYALSPPPANRF